MNFLESLVAEFYAYQGYFVRTNIHYAPRALGGYAGEIDVLALHAPSRELVHIECSMDALSWVKRKENMSRKFTAAKPHYPKLLGFDPSKVTQIAIVGTNDSPLEFGSGIVHWSIPTFVMRAQQTVAMKDPMKAAVPETFPLMRAIQFAGWYSQKQPQTQAGQAQSEG